MVLSYVLSVGKDTGYRINRKRKGLKMRELTPRQNEILRLVSQGFTNKGIAFQLGITEQTVKNHITKIFKTLKVNNRLTAVLKMNEEFKTKIIVECPWMKLAESCPVLKGIDEMIARERENCENNAIKTQDSITG